MSEDARLERLGLLHLKDQPEELARELERRRLEYDRRADEWDEERGRRRADLARQRLRAYLDGTCNDPGYEPEDLLMHDVWALESADFEWLLAATANQAFDRARRRMVIDLVKGHEKHSQIRLNWE
jgi:hypothetical protein